MTANGTIHAFNSATKKSLEGRWTPTDEGARFTTKAVTCGRCVQLAAPKVAKEDTPVKTLAKPVAKKASKATAAKADPNLTAVGPMLDSYDGFAALLEHNEIEFAVSPGPDGTSLDMAIGAWQYRVFSADQSSSGNWAIVYSEDLGSSQEEEVFESEEDAIAYLIEDAILEPAPKRPVKKAAKATAAAKTRKALPGNDDDVDGLLTASITAAKAAYDAARSGDYPDDLMTALFDLTVAGVEIRKAMAASK
jgi:hypothetical protein